MDFKFKLGERVKDVISGFSGVVMAQARYLTGCDQYGIMPTALSKDGKRPEWEYFDENRLVRFGKGVKLPEEKGSTKKVKGFDGNHSERM